MFTPNIQKVGQQRHVWQPIGWTGCLRHRTDVCKVKGALLLHAHPGILTSRALSSSVLGGRFRPFGL